MDEYAAGRTPNPCLRCNEKIKFAAVLDRALGARLRRRRHRPLRAAARPAPTALSRCTAPSTTARTSPTCSACSTRSSSRTRCSRSATPPSRTVRDEAGRRGLLVADKPDSHDICFVADGDNAGWLREKLGDRAPNHGGAIVDDATGEVLGQPRRHLRLHHRPAQGACGSAARRPTASRGSCSTSSRSPARSRVGPREALAVDRLEAVRPRWCGTAPEPARGHRAAARPRRRAPRRRHDGRRRDRGRDRAARPGAGHRARPGRGGLRRHPRRRLGHDHRHRAHRGRRRPA